MATSTTTSPTRDELLRAGERSSDERSSDERSSEQASSEGPCSDETVMSLDSFRRYTEGSLVASLALLLLLPLVVGSVPTPPDPVGVMSWLAVLVVLATMIPLIRDHLRSAPGQRRPRRQHWLLVTVGFGASVVAMVTWLWVGDDMLWAFGPAMVASIAILDLPRRRRRAAIAAAVVIAAVVAGAVTALRGLEEAGLLLVTGPAVTAFALSMTLATMWTWDIVVQLDRARRQAATLAVANERLRFAADLHDIQGHHLQVIALKSELAGRLVPADPQAAAREMDAVRGLAADALADTRAVVQGYRRTTLDTELHNARAVLSSAGIDARLRLDDTVGAADLSDDDRHLLGLVVREAVTNVLRHSDATWAELTVTGGDDLRLVVSNDGAGPGPVGTDGGLADLDDRLAAAGGAITTRVQDGTFQLEARLPVTPTADGPTTAGPEQAATP